MTQRDVIAIAGGVVVGVVVAAGLGVSMPFGGRETPVTLIVDPSGACTLGKATTVTAKMSENLTWKIENYCTELSRTVAVGDFRTGGGAGAADCSAEGANYPFDPGTRSISVEAGTQRPDGSIRPGKANLKLKVRGRDSLGNGPITYAFNICLDGVPADPLLLVER